MNQNSWVKLLDEMETQAYNSELAQTKRAMQKLQNQVNDLTQQRDFYKVELDKAGIRITQQQEEIQRLKGEIDNLKQTSLLDGEVRRKCKTCKKEFITRHYKQEFCSTKCRNAHNNPNRKKKKGEAIEEAINASRSPESISKIT